LERSVTGSGSLSKPSNFEEGFTPTASGFVTLSDLDRPHLNYD
jgi:hypothetical protein